MIFIISGILAALCYSSDSIFGKIALDGLPLNIYFIIVSFIYTIIGLILFFFNYNDFFKYLKKEHDNNYYYLKYAIIAVLLGTIAGDYLMFYTINKSKKINLPIAITLIHLAPIFSVFLVYFWFKQQLNFRALFGIILVFIGTLITINNIHH
jgi:drug/metabolite transporter (DMT)-like permease